MTLELKIIPPVQFTICVALMVALSKTFTGLTFSYQIDLAWVIALLFIASIIGALALITFRQHKTTFHPHTPEKTSTIVDTGVYAFSRNPMYLAMAIALMALAIYSHNYSAFAVLPLFIGYLTQFQIKPEERMLDKLFPNDYQAYCAKVRRWL